MKVSTLRKIDAWLGVPACLLLTLVRRATAWRRRGTNRRGPRRVVFVKLAEQGATVLAFGALRRAVERFGRENVYFVVFLQNRFVLDVMDVVPPENVLAVPTGGLVRAAVGGLRVVGRLRRLRPEVAMDYEFFARSSAVLAYLSGARTRVGLHRFAGRGPYRGDLMTHRVRYDPGTHTSDLFYGMVEVADRPPGWHPLPPSHPAADRRPVFRPGPHETERVRELICREAGTDRYRPLVLLNANASDLLPIRKWPADRYVQLARRLIAGHGNLHVGFTGAPEEAGAAGQLVRAVGSPRCFSLAGKTTLRQLLVLYHLADVLVTNDSGPAHFATMTPIRVVTLFGPETPVRFGSRSPTARILWENIECSPCVDAMNHRFSRCRDNRCMQRISVDRVEEAVVQALHGAWSSVGG